MARAGYTAVTEADVALAAATPKSILGVKSPGQFGVNLTGLHIGFRGTTSGQVPPLVELCYCTFATNAPGTNSITATVKQIYGRVITPGFTAAYDWSAEPTVITVLENLTLLTTGGLAIYDFVEGREYDTPVNDGFVVRVTSANIVNVRASLHFERC